MITNRFTFELLLISTWFLGVMAVKFLLPALPLLADQLHISTTYAKYTISIFLFGKASGMLLFGPLSDKYGRKIFMLLGLLIFSFGNLLAYYANQIEILLIARLIQGWGVSATVLMGRAMINDIYKNNKAAVVFSHIFLIASIIIACLPIIGSFLAARIEWNFIFLIIGAYSLFIAFWCYLFLPETHFKAAGDALTLVRAIDYYRIVLKHPLFLGYVLCSIFMIAGESAFNTASSFLLIKTFDLSIPDFGIMMTLLAIGHFLGTLLCGQLVKKFNLSIMMGTGVSILAISTVIMAIANNFGFSHLILLIAPMILFHIGTGFVMTITAVGVVTPFPNLVGISSSASLLLNFSCSALSSLLMSHLSTKTVGPVTCLIAGYSVCAFLAWYFLVMPYKHTQTAAQTS